MKYSNLCEVYNTFMLWKLETTPRIAFQILNLQKYPLEGLPVLTQAIRAIIMKVVDMVFQPGFFYDSVSNNTLMSAYHRFWLETS
jgi:hypothetical protein